MVLSDKLFRKKVEKLYPEISEKVNVTPRLSNLELIEILFAFYVDHLEVPERGSEQSEFRLLFIGIVLKLYDPDYLSGFKKKVRDGLSGSLGSVLDINDSGMSWWFSQVSGRLRIYKDFSDAVDTFSNLLVSSLNQ